MIKFVTVPVLIALFDCAQFSRLGARHGCINLRAGPPLGSL